MQKKTKIVATLGPASDNENTIEQMVRAGVNVFRLNFSHGTHEYHKSNIDKIRNVEARLGVRIGILQDICGPKIRIGKLQSPFELNAGDRLDICADEIIGEKVGEKHYKVSLNQPQILPMLKSGEYVYLYDGSIRAKVIQSGKSVVQTYIENNGVLNSNKGVNFPNTRIGIDVITQKDRVDMEFGAKNGVNFVAISFVQNAQDVLKAKSILKELGSRANVISKIEKFDAVENIDEIIAVSDGVMVARGDLGIEVPFYKVPTIQKLIIKKANAASKPVITATQMMLSMAEHETATRAEISDVANAVLDGTDAVMLSEESAIGKNPAAVVEAMSQTIIQTQQIYPYNKFDEFEFLDETDMVASSAASLAVRIKADGILSITGSGKSAIKLARNRTAINIIAIAHDEQTAHSLTLAWGVTPALVVEKSKLNILMANVIKEAFDNGYVTHDKTYLITAGYPTGVEGSTNLIRIIRKDQLDYYLEAARSVNLV
ncbi:pyruvate kinase [Campylobacter sp. faydin G-24]|uniref:Pyruvate kinase n=1 Tax=Campylobacter anatolicus TaxID=2829105 RepID=A0ABS5HG89_9BACT|nr:pyruvate kinase [Campylobacter anatolicus]MBR8462438.1 pyruvate kinase [Campylobacter anatolicus]MBR8463112.1 pyruvate kinase [Campylobacter anatolicus]MBR8465566.1 pyruvate kinase [Campylobacter anatolicus]